MKQLVRHTFDAIGTAWSIETATPLSRQDVTRIDCMVEEFEQTYSRFIASSLVSRIRAATGGGDYTFPSSIEVLYDMYARLERVSNGAINPLVGESLEQHCSYCSRIKVRDCVSPATFF